MRDQTSAADGFNKALEKARHDLVVFAQQDIYLPRGWDSQFRRQFHEAERQLGSVGVAGVFCYRSGWTRSSSRSDGTRRSGSIPRWVSISTAPISVSAPTGKACPSPCSTPPAFTTRCSPTCSRRSTARASSCCGTGPTSGPCTAAWVDSTPWRRSRCRPPGPTTSASARRSSSASWRTRAQLDDRRQHIANMEASLFWRLRNLTHRVLRRP
jgi:hypothetical protein